MKQMEADRDGQFLFISVEYDNGHTSEELMNTSRDVHEHYKTVEENNDKEVNGVGRFIWGHIGFE